jgi:pimeloyl-ACP methyl ester carboxylesterase
MKKRDGSTSGSRRALVGGALVMSAAAAGLPFLVRKLDHKRDEGADSIAGIRLDLEHHFVTSPDGTPIHVTETGAGEQTVILLHGWTCDESVFRFQQEHLAGRYRVLTMELRGHGESGIPADRDYSMERMAEDLKAVIDHFDPPDFAIGGFSMGGFTTLKFCERFGGEYAGRLKGIILLDSTGVDIIGGMFMGGLVKLVYPFPLANILKLLGYPRRLFDPIRDLIGNTPGAYLLVRFMAYGDSPCGCYVEKQREMTFNTPVTTTWLALKSIFDYRIDSFEDIKVPVLLLVGEKDRLTSADANRRTAEMLPNATLKVFPSAGHNSLLERWEKYNAEMESFFDTVFSST